MPQKLGSVQGVVQFTKERIDLSTNGFGPPFSEQIVASRVMPRRDLPPLVFKAGVTRLGEPRTSKKLIRYAVKRGYNDGERLPADFSEDNFADIANAFSGGKGGPPKLQNFHGADDGG
jgi:hypothetical protein